MDDKDKIAELERLKRQMKDEFGEHWQETDALFYAVGLGITWWSTLEDVLVAIGAVLLGTTNEKAGLV